MEFLLKILNILCAAIIVLLMRTTSSFIKVRLGRISPKDRIGHAAINPELYLCSLDAGIEEKYKFDILFYPITKRDFNNQLIKMWRRSLPMGIFSNFEKLLTYVYELNKKIIGWEKYVVEFQKGWFSLVTYGDPNNLLEKYPSHLSFTEEEIYYGNNRLKELGLKNGEYICFHSRTSKYLEALIPENDWKYHNYRDSSIGNYIKAMDNITMLNYHAVRMGLIVDEKLITDNTSIIDYANLHREDFLDIFLIAYSRFVVFTHCGLKHVAIAFRVPVVCVNVLSYLGIFYLQKNNICVPKKLWSKSKKKVLSFREIFCSDIVSYTTANQYIDNDIEILENTPDEINDAAMEMEMRISGEWKSEKNDDDLQNEFKKIALECTLPDGMQINNIIPGGIKCRLSTKFLRNHDYLLH